MSIFTAKAKKTEERTGRADDVCFTSYLTSKEDLVKWIILARYSIETVGERYITQFAYEGMMRRYNRLVDNGEDFSELPLNEFVESGEYPTRMDQIHSNFFHAF